LASDKGVEIDSKVSRIFLAVRLVWLGLGARSNFMLILILIFFLQKKFHIEEI